MATNLKNQPQQIVVEAPVTDLVTLVTEALSISRDVATGIRVDAYDLMSMHGQDHADILCAAIKTGDIFSDAIHHSLLEVCAVLEEIILEGTTETHRCQDAEEANHNLIWIDRSLDDDATNASRCLTVMIGWQVALDSVRDRIRAEKIVAALRNAA